MNLLRLPVKIFSFNVANIYNSEADQAPILDLSLKKNEDIQCFNTSKLYFKALHVLFTQMSVYKGIKLFREQVVSAIFKEFKATQ